MNKIRVEHKAHFTILANEAVRDGRLSFAARGVLAYLLSLPDGALVGRREIASSGPDGEWRVRGALQELVSAGYVQRRTVRGRRGRLRTETVVVEVPALSTGAEPSPVVENQPPVDRAAVAPPVVDFPPGGPPPRRSPSTQREGSGVKEHLQSLREVLPEALAETAGRNNGGEGSAQRPQLRTAKAEAPRDRLALRLWGRFPELGYDEALALVDELRAQDVADVVIDEGIGYTLERDDVRSPRFLVTVVTDWAKQRASGG